MKLSIILIIIGAIALLIVKIILKPTNTPPVEATEQAESAEQANENLPIKGFYQPKWLLTYNEKDAYRQLKVITDKYNFPLFVKVRLLDLVEPRKNNNPKYKTYFYKIQAKHVDFVICNEKLVAKLIIELDDSTHDTTDRKKRDGFVDEVLTSTGYKVLHIRAVNISEIEKELQSI